MTTSESSEMTTHEYGTAGRSTGDEKPARKDRPQMRAIVQDRYGTPEVLEIRQVAIPDPAPDQVLIQIVASSVNAADWHKSTGTPYIARTVAGLTRPKNPIPGADVAGIVVAVGDDVTRFEVGDEVFGDTGYGAYAEFAVASPQALAYKPAGIGFEEAAATPLAALTALQGLRDLGGVEEGMRVVVNGASGGVGTFAVQIAKALGAEVTAVCSTNKVDMVGSIGADRVIDYTAQDFVEVVQEQHVLLDNAGTRPWKETSRVLADDGINVTIAGPKHAWLGPLRNLIARKVASRFDNRRFTWFVAEMNQDDLETLGGMLASGQIRPVIEATYPLDRVPEALRAVGEGHSIGKRVIVV